MTDDPIQVTVTVDDTRETFEVRVEETLLESLRERFGPNGVRYCCGIGVCGTCTVLLDGEPASSCLLLTAMMDGHEIVTPRGLAHPDLSPAQRAFGAAGAYQCSYCIPAMALTVHGVLDNAPESSFDDICSELGGNLCRCGTYPQVRAAVEAVLAARVAADRSGSRDRRPQ